MAEDPWTTDGFDDPFGDTMSAQAPSPQPAASMRPVEKEPAVLKMSGDEEGSKFEIFITDPEKHGDGIDAYVTYTVSTSTSLPQYASTHLTVARRYRDFVWLREELTLAHPGVIVAPLPEKVAIGRFNTEFIDQRRRELEKFLRALTAHPRLHTDPTLQLFLQSPKELPSNKSKTQDAAKSIFGFGKILSEMTFGAGEEADGQFSTRRGELTMLENDMGKLLMATEGLVEKRRDESEGFVWVASVAEALSTTPGGTVSPSNTVEAPDALTGALHLFALTCDRIQMLHQQHANSDVAFFEVPLRHNVHKIGAVKEAMASRNRAYASWQTAEHAKEEARNTVAKTGDVESREDATKQQMSAATAEADLQRITNIFREELDRYDVDRLTEMRQALVVFIQTQINFKQQTRALWGNLLSELEKEC